MKSTFWNLLKNNGIVVPIIQRDYAQGRSGERYQHIRENFLKQIGAVLNGDATLSGNLDFVYGMEEVNPINNEPSVYPIDGQQRLTTLWLVHWYLAYLTRNLEKKDIADILRRFSYETRTSSREFCNEICGLKYAEEGTRDIVAYIKQQTWFMSSWEQDPTIKAMLNMLRGENENSKDGIEKLFCNCAIESAWCYLTGSECALQFHYLRMNTHDNGLESFDLSDDLYIKMNARGKALTNFENFKADFVGWMQKEMPGQWVEIAANIDNAWTDLFWKNIKNWKNNKNGCIDEIFFAFINRFVFNNFLCQKKDENNWKYAETDVKKLDIWNLYGYEGDDSNVSYNGFSLYNNDKYCSITPEMVDRLNKTLVSLNNSAISKITSVLPEWAQDEELFFIPTYCIEKEGNIITILDRNQRVLFYAICVYLEQTEAPSLEDESFKQWMRVVCNITENNQTGLTDKLHLINDLSKGCQDILSYLSKNPESVIEGHKGNAQLQEEIDKAKRLYSNEFYEVCKNAESHPWLKGRIRDLFGDVLDDMCSFRSRLDKLYEISNECKIVDEKGNITGYDNKWMKSCLSKELISQTFSMSNSSQNAKEMATGPFSEVLKKVCSSNNNPLEIDSNTSDWRAFVVNTDKWLEKSKTKKVIQRDTCHYLVNKGDFRGYYWLLPESRFSLSQCIQNKDGILEPEWNFTFNNNHFLWNENNYIYIMSNYNSDSRIKRSTAKEVEDSELKNFYCFKVDGNLKPDDMKGKLQDLINEVNIIIH